MNHKLAAMGISKINEETTAPHGKISSIPACSAVPPGWKGMWVQPAADLPPGTLYTTINPGTWLLIYCLAINPGHTGSDTIDNTGSGNTGTTAVNTSTTAVNTSTTGAERRSGLHGRVERRN